MHSDLAIVKLLLPFRHPFDTYYWSFEFLKSFSDSSIYPSKNRLAAVKNVDNLNETVLMSKYLFKKKNEIPQWSTPKKLDQKPLFSIIKSS